MKQYYKKGGRMAGILNIQIKSLYADRETNLKKIEYFIEKNSDKKLDMVIMPEFFSTSIGYLECFEPEDGGETIKFISSLAKKYNTNIIAGSVVRQKADGRLYNTSFAINRAGEVVKTYDKVHLFNYMGGTEGQRITAGNEIAVVDFDFARVGMTICFDIRYPLFFNKLIKENVDMIVLPTAWLIPDAIYNNPETLKSAKDMWQAMCRTRAYDNQVYFIVSNQTKTTTKGFSGIGESMIISPAAEILQNAHDDECAIYSDIDLEIVDYYRKLFPVAELD